MFQYLDFFSSLTLMFSREGDYTLPGKYYFRFCLSFMTPNVGKWTLVYNNNQHLWWNTEMYSVFILSTKCIVCWCVQCWFYFKCICQLLCMLVVYIYCCRMLWIRLSILFHINYIFAFYLCPSTLYSTCKLLTTCLYHTYDSPCSVDMQMSVIR